MIFKTYNVVLTESLRNEINSIAKSKGLSFSAYVRLLLKDAIKKGA